MSSPLRASTFTQSLRSLALCSLPLTALLACTAVGNPNEFTTSSGAGAGANAGGAGGASSGTTGTGGDPIINPSGTGGNGQGGGDECASAEVEGTLIPLNMFITVDKSGSMSGSKWTAALQAFTQFFQDPNADGISVALRFWPDNGCDDINGCGASVIAACQTPQVDIGPLSDPVQEQALVDAFNGQSPTGITPTSVALAGATKWAANYVIAKNHMEQAVVVMVTDGEPTACDTNVTNIANLADVAYQGAGVLTFMVGMVGADQQMLDQVAVAGHTGQAFMIGNGNAAADLLAAMKAIQASAIACSFPMPMAPPGQVIDLLQVDVEYTPGMGGMKTTLPKVANAGQCTAAGGWYYDNPTMPTMILMCPASCQAAQNDPGGKVNIVLGCIKDVM